MKCLITVYIINVTEVPWENAAIPSYRLLHNSASILSTAFYTLVNLMSVFSKLGTYPALPSLVVVFLNIGTGSVIQLTCLASFKLLGKNLLGGLGCQGFWSPVMNVNWHNDCKVWVNLCNYHSNISPLSLYPWMHKIYSFLSLITTTISTFYFFN